MRAGLCAAFQAKRALLGRFSGGAGSHTPPCHAVCLTCLTGVVLLIGRSLPRCRPPAVPHPVPCPSTPPQELRFLRGPLSAADLSALVDATSVVGSTTVGLSAVLEAVHTNVPGTDRHPLPVELEVGDDSLEWHGRARRPPAALLLPALQPSGRRSALWLRVLHTDTPTARQCVPAAVAVAEASIMPHTFLHTTALPRCQHSP